MSKKLDVKGLKDHTPIQYIRLSFNEIPDKDSKKDVSKIDKIKNQKKRLDNFLRDNKLKPVKPENVFMEVASGGDPTRPVWRQAINKVAAMKGKRFLVVTDLSRWSRDMRTGVAETIPLYVSDVPLVSADDMLVIGTKQRPNADGDTLLGIKITLAGGERENLRRRTGSGMQAKKESGVYGSGGLDLFPDAFIDVYDFIEENLYRAMPIKEGGIGFAALGRLVMDEAGPMGPTSQSWARKAINRISELKMKMSPEQYDTWVAYRKRVRELERVKGFGDWGVKALRYRTNGFISAPLDPLFSNPPVEEDIQEWMMNPKDNLSFKDSKIYKSVVSKR